MATKIVMTKEAALSIFNSYTNLKEIRNITTNKTGTKLFEGIFDQYGIPIVDSNYFNGIYCPVFFNYHGFKFEIKKSDIYIKYSDYPFTFFVYCDNRPIYYEFYSYITIGKLGFFRSVDDVYNIRAAYGDDIGYRIDLKLFCYNNDKIDYYGGSLYCYRDSSIDFNAILSLINANDFVFIEAIIDKILQNLLDNSEIIYSILSFQNTFSKPLYETVGTALGKIYKQFSKIKSIDKEEF